MTGAIIWLMIAVILCVIEGATVQLLCIWFAGGALVAMLGALMGAPVLLQLLLFFVTSVAVLAVGRPLLKKKLRVQITPTNADAVIGQTGIVTVEVNNLMETGRVTANGLDWSARSADGGSINVKQKVSVKGINGVKLIVEPIPEE